MMVGEIGQKDKEAANVQVTFKALVPVVLQTPEKRKKMEEDLERIGCADLLTKPWSLKDEGLVRNYFSEPQTS